MVLRVTGNDCEYGLSHATTMVNVRLPRVLDAILTQLYVFMCLLKTTSADSTTSQPYGNEQIM